MEKRTPFCWKLQVYCLDNACLELGLKLSFQINAILKEIQIKQKYSKSAEDTQSFEGTIYEIERQEYATALIATDNKYKL